MDDVTSVVREGVLIGVLFHSMAVFGMTWVLRYTNGPWGIIRKLRMLAGVQYIEELDPYTGDISIVEVIPKDKHFAELFGCFWCMSVWVSLLLLMVVFPHIRVQAFIIVWWGSIGINGFMHELVS